MELSGTASNMQHNNHMVNEAKAATAPVTKSSDTTNLPVQIPAVPEGLLRQAEQRRKDHLQRVMEQKKFKAAHGVEDQDVALFKDKTGQYIARFTDMNDQSVTYMSEPEILRFSASEDSYLQLEI